MRAVRAGAAYFVVVFAVGFILGALRNIFLMPHLGETVAVVVEVPVMLIASWFACRAVLARIAVPPRRGDRLLMGGVALSLLWIAEALLSVAMGLGIEGYLAVLATPAGMIGIAAQLVFAAFPMLQQRLASG